MLDFFALEKQNSSNENNKSRVQKFLDRRRSFHGVSKVDTELIKSVICKNENLTHSLGCSVKPSNNSADTAPMTIFYNGTVSVFDHVTPIEAESVFEFALEESRGEKKNSDADLEPLCGDFPIAGRKSLQRFLELRKERLTSMSPLRRHK